MSRCSKLLKDIEEAKKISIPQLTNKLLKLGYSEEEIISFQDSLEGSSSEAAVIAALIESDIATDKKDAKSML